MGGGIFGCLHHDYVWLLGKMMENIKRTAPNLENLFHSLEKTVPRLVKTIPRLVISKVRLVLSKVLIAGGGLLIVVDKSVADACSRILHRSKAGPARWIEQPL